MSQAVAEYYDLSPTKRLAASELTPLYGMLKDAMKSPDYNTTTRDRRTLANIALEISLDPQLDPNKARIWRSQTAQAFQRVKNDNMARLQSLHALYVQGNAGILSTANATRSYVQRLHKEYVQQGPDSNSEQVHLLTRNALVLSLVGHTGLKGLVAYPSFDRQSQSRHDLDDQRLAWGLTVESDGTTLPMGTYHSRVMGGSTAGVEGALTYHRSISVIDAERHLCVDPNNPQSLYGLAHMVTELTTTGSHELAGGLYAMRDGLMERFADTGPAIKELHVLAPDSLQPAIR